jgi:dienelactone hydrolase
MKIRRVVGIAVKALLGVLFLGIIAIIGLLAWLNWQVPAEVTLPKPTGPYAVGRDFFDWTDAKRTDPFAPTPGTPREITGWIWYPAQESSEPIAEYQPKAVREALLKRANRVIAFVARLVMVDQANVHSHALERPAVLVQPQTFPVILLKPGYGGLIHQYSAFAEDLASFGYVVVGSDSPYTTPVVVYKDGRIANQSKAGHPPENTPGKKSELAPGWPNDLMLPAAKVWTADMRFMLDRLQEINVAGSTEMFSGRLDLRSVGAFGHSFGGSTSLQFCKVDSRCGAVIDVDGGLWGDVALGGLKKPALFMMSDRPIFEVPVATLEPNAKALVEAIERIRSGLPNKPNQLILKGSSHYNFADSALLTEQHLARWTGSIGPIGQRRVLDVARRYIRAFFDTYLKGKPDKLLQGTSTDYPEVVIE